MPSAQMPIHPEQSPRPVSHFGVLVREDAAFANSKGVEKSSIRKRAEKSLEKLQEPLRKFLEPDEAVFCIARAQIMPGSFELFFLGWHAMFLAPAVLVITNHRILHVLIDRSGKWKRMLRCARWSDLEEAKVKGLLGARLQIKYRDGSKEVYSAIARGDGSSIQHLLEVVMPAGASETSPALAMTSLCPECRSPLSREIYECPHCRMAFKDEKTAMRRSWLIPGGGFFYTGHAFLGILHGVVEAILLFVVAYWLLVALGVLHPEPNSGGTPMDMASALVVAGMFGALLALDKWIMATVTRKQIRNFIPAA